MKMEDVKLTPFLERLKQILKDDVPGWAEKIGVSQLTIRERWFKGSHPGGDKIVKICEVAGISAEWLLRGKSPNVAPMIKVEMTDQLKTDHDDFNYNNFIPVNLLKDTDSSLSPAEVNENDIEGACLMFAESSWLPGKPDDYTCCRITENTMYPILETGDVVAIDHSQKDPNKLHRKMVAFRKNGGVTVQWLSLREDGVVIGVPENKDSLKSAISLQPDKIQTGIVGKIAWWWSKRA